MSVNTKHRRPKRGDRGGVMVGTYEVIYCNTRKSWQIWHPENGFIAAYREKSNAITKAKELINNNI
jgi:hypothetical protein